MATPREDDSHLVEHMLDSQEVFRGGFLRVARDTVRLPDGKTARREYIKHPGAVVVVPLLDDGRLVMERQYRYPVGQVMVEFPAGKLDAGEPPLACGQRELLEETGYTAREWARAGRMHLAVGYSDEAIEIWFARGLALAGARPDEGEFVEVITAAPEEFLAWCRDGVVTDAKSLATAVWVQNVLAGTWKLDWQPHNSIP